MPALAAGRLTLAALAAALASAAVSVAASVATAGEASASTPPLRRGVAAYAAGHGNGHGGGGGQVAAGGVATARQFGSGNGKFNQNLNGVYSPTFMMGQQQTGITVGGRINTQGAFCGPGPRHCKIWQNMPVNAIGW
ncbi:hypothetical protein F5972_23725 [Microbispora cellulosiformans]|uniref:Uncharacterized protein n=1 Tax=Microbispora cellulosiformans TaxID=2614688 RepID=A0A5J5JZ23_9ACTN|nr:hypothetical protein [Microbispora cellulosiformans]KAA9376426.1 hypothetical protein F5972_23725 [Microbispora cellulosiformans]